FSQLFASNLPSSSTIDTPSLHDALPIFGPIRLVMIESLLAVLQADGHLGRTGGQADERPVGDEARRLDAGGGVLQNVPLNRREGDRKRTRLNSSHQISSYAVFCLEKRNA